MALMKGIYVDTEGKEHIVDLKLNADGKLEISGLQVDTLEMGSLQIASGSDASELQITNGAAKANIGILQADNSISNPTGDSVQAWDHIDGAIVSNIAVSNLLTTEQAASLDSPVTTAALTGTFTVSTNGTTGSIALSGAATGTVTRGNPIKFTAYQATLTLTPTGTPTLNSILGSTDPQLVFAQNATTKQQLALISYAAIIDPTKEYVLTIQNTSVVTGVTITVQPSELAVNGSDIMPILTSFEVPVQSSRSVLLRGILPGINCYFFASPDESMTDSAAANRVITMRLRKF